MTWESTGHDSYEEALRAHVSDEYAMHGDGIFFTTETLEHAV
jgi:hypothetical protein